MERGFIFFFFCRERSIVSIFLNFYKSVYFPLRYFFRRRLIYDTAFHCRKILCRVSVLVRRRLWVRGTSCCKRLIPLNKRNSMLAFRRIVSLYEKLVCIDLYKRTHVCIRDAMWFLSKSFPFYLFFNGSSRASSLLNWQDQCLLSILFSFATDSQ